MDTDRTMARSESVPPSPYRSLRNPGTTGGPRPAALGRGSQRGGGLAVSERGGGRVIGLIVLDDASRAVTVAEQVERLLAQERVDLLIGPYASNLALAAAEVAERFGVPIWNHGGSSNAIAGRGFSWLINLASPAEPRLLGLLELVRAQAPACPASRCCRAPAVRFLSRGGHGGAEQIAPSLGFELVYRGTYPLDPSRPPDALPRPSPPRARPLLGVGIDSSPTWHSPAPSRPAATARLVGLAASIELFQAEVRSADGFLGPSHGSPRCATGRIPARPQPSWPTASRLASAWPPTTRPPRLTRPAWSPSAVSSWPARFNRPRCAQPPTAWQSPPATATSGSTGAVNDKPTGWP